MRENDLFEREELPYRPARRVIPSFAGLPYRRPVILPEPDPEDLPYLPARRVLPRSAGMPTRRWPQLLELDAEELPILGVRRVRLPQAPASGLPYRRAFMGFDGEGESDLFLRGARFVAGFAAPPRAPRAGWIEEPIEENAVFRPGWLGTFAQPVVGGAALRTLALIGAGR